MKIYIAAAAPGNEQNREEGNELNVPSRLLSYFLIIKKQFECDFVFNLIKTKNRQK